MKPSSFRILRLDGHTVSAGRPAGVETLEEAARVAVCCLEVGRLPDGTLGFELGGVPVRAYLHIAPDPEFPNVQRFLAKEKHLEERRKELDALIDSLGLDQVIDIVKERL